MNENENVTNSLPEPDTRLEAYLAKMAGKEVNLPDAVTKLDSYLKAISENGPSGGGDFIVELTPTSETGGTMDHSNVEILEAYRSGKRIFFDIEFDGALCRVQATLSASFSDFTFPSFNAYGIATDGVTLVNLFVDPSDEESYTFTINLLKINTEPVSMYVDFVYSYDGHTGLYTMSEDYSTIKAAISAGTPVYARMVDGDILPINSNSSENRIYVVKISTGINGTSSILTNHLIECRSGNTATSTSTFYDLTLHSNS